MLGGIFSPFTGLHWKQDSVHPAFPTGKVHASGGSSARTVGSPGRPLPYPRFVSLSSLSFVALTSWRSLRCSRMHLGNACSTCLGQETPWVWSKACVLRSGGRSSLTRHWHLTSNSPTPLRASRVVRSCPWRWMRPRRRRLANRPNPEPGWI